MIPHHGLPKGHRLGGRYHLEEQLGSGATSVVYRALDLTTRTVVALKLLDPLLTGDEESLERFSRELEILREVTHPNVVRVYGLERDEDFCFLSMEYLGGSSLRTRLERRGRLRPHELVPIARRLAAALDACHRRGIAHRDVKPSNVIFDDRAEPKLVDFGVAAVCVATHLTRTGTYMGTPDYMAPEQFRRSVTDPRSDVYSLGVVLCEMLAGRLPFAGGSLARVATRSDEVEPLTALVPDVPEWLDAIVSKCLEASPERRYQSAFELELDLGVGAGSAARYRPRSVERTCLRCGESMLDGLGFCHQCGSAAAEHFGRGRHAVILYRCDDPDELCRRTAALGVQPNASLRRRLERLPRVLVRGLDAGAAHAVAKGIFGGSAELAVSSELPRELRLPGRYLAYGLLGAAFHLGNTSALSAVPVGVSASGGLLVALYWWRARPLWTLSDLPPEGARPISAETLELAPRIARLLRRETKVLLGLIVRAFQNLSSPLRTEPLRALLERAVTAGEAMDRCELALSGQTLAELIETRESLRRRLEDAPGLSESQDVIDKKAAVEKRIREYRQRRDLYTRLHFALIDLNRSLVSMEHGEAAVAFDPGALEIAEREPSRPSGLQRARS